MQVLEPRRQVGDAQLDQRGEDRQSVRESITYELIESSDDTDQHRYSGILRDVSIGGAGLLTSRPIVTRYVRVHFLATDEEPLVIEVAHCDFMGCFYYSGGRIIQ